jgi:hypothetical protein
MRPARRRAPERVGRHDLDRALELSESGIVTADLVEVLTESHVKERG